MKLPSAEALQVVAEQRASGYVSADPFPHAVIDDFLPAETAAKLHESFPGLEDDVWKKHMHAHSNKFSCADPAAMPEAIREVVLFFNSPTFVSFLERLTGIRGLTADPAYNGGGLHRIERGGFLKIHADFNIHPELKLERRLNILFYLNRDWKEEYGGHLELWDRSMTRCVKRIAPVLNRFAVFSTSDSAYHGHPDPLNCPPGMARKSIAAYYYTKPRVSEVAAPHSTLYQQRPQDRTFLQKIRRRLGF